VWLVDVEDRAVGCVVGLALGDAAGAPFEFLRASEIPDPLSALELPRGSLPPGSTTDDTAMALNLVGSLVDRGRFDPADVIRRHVDWFQTEPPDIGHLTRRVLRAASNGASAEDAARG